MKYHASLITGAALLVFGMIAHAEIKTVAERNQNENATSAFKFKNVPAPATADASTRAKFSIVDGERDGNGGDLDKLHDGKLASEEDQPAENFFFTQGSDGGRLLVELADTIEIKQVNTYSWHPNTRGPQVYKLYASDGKPEGFNAQPKRATDPEKAGWKLIAKVDTRPNEGQGGGQYGVSISDSEGMLGKYRYLLFDISRTEEADPFGNTFYSEIDVVGKDDATGAAAAASVAPDAPFVVHSPDGYCEISIDTSKAPDLKQWAEQKLAPVLAEWYPKIVAMLPSDGYAPPKKFSIAIRPGNGVAATGGTRVTANSDWLKRELNGEAIGALLHEEVHVVQQYGAGRRNPNAKRAPGWVTEAIPDYIRWFKYEPQSHGADLEWMKGRRNFTPRYDASYRISANFLDWLVGKYDQDIIRKLNAMARQATYSEDLWKNSCGGKTLAELGEEWQTEVQAKLGKQTAAAPARTVPATATAQGSTGQEPAKAADNDAKANTLSDQEKAAGWKLLFNGKDTEGWHNFKRQDIKPGWQVTNNTLACIDPHNAGDLCTQDQYDSFELQLDYNISEGGNSGIMYHVTDQGGAAWATGPEFQLEDNAKAADPVRCGWLYALYQPPIDPNTGKTLDATKPAGQWNHVRLLISPEKCEHEINGVKYFDYVLGSEDFNQRVAKSKFSTMPFFAKAEKGYLTLQGDHGQVCFRNIKLRPIEAKH